jgi:DNA (cytosine-5)-methyltransferase 1
LTVKDQFAGAGGFTAGAIALGLKVVIAINHWSLAIQTHNTNYPQVDHDLSDISETNPRKYPSTHILISGPECTQQTYANGKKKPGKQLHLLDDNTPDPAEERSRATMWDVVRFSAVHNYGLVVVENVVWTRKWREFNPWLRDMHNLGYLHQIVYYNSMFAGVPQSRDRMYVVFWKKGNRTPNLEFLVSGFCPKCKKVVQGIQGFKKPHFPWGWYGPKKQYLYYCPACGSAIYPAVNGAGTIIDWSLPIVQVGRRVRHLKPMTIKRIQAGLDKFQGGCLLQTTRSYDEKRYLALSSPSPVQTSRQELAVAATSHFMVELRNCKGPTTLKVPASTVCSGGGHHGLVQVPNSFLSVYNGNGRQNSKIEVPSPTVTGSDRLALVQPENLQVEDCYFRMLQPEELKLLQGFPREFIVLGNKREQTKQIGNAVTPPFVKLLLERGIQTFA